MSAPSRSHLPVLSFRLFICAMIGATLLAGCANHSPVPSRLYQLSALPGAPKTSAGASIGVGPIAWPDYLDRRPVLVRVDANTLRASEIERWAEPLDLNFARVLRENLAKLSDKGPFVVYPWSAANPPQSSVRLEVLQLDSDSTGAAVLRARWHIVGAPTPETGGERAGEWRVQAKDGSVAAAVAAQSEAVAAMAKDIAEALR